MKGFTLIELLIVLAIIGVLIYSVSNLVSKAEKKEQAKTVQSIY